jgi:hypothetical protein
MVLALGGIGAGCKQRSEPPPAPRELPAMPAGEVKRDRDACQAYLDKVCGCAANQPALAERCRLARSLVDAVGVGAEVATNPDSTRRDAVQSNAAVRGVAKECIEQLAKLPADGCR